MAFTSQELEIIKFGQQNGKSRAEVEQAISNFRNGVKPTKVASTTEEPTVTQQAKDLAVGFAKGAGRTALEVGQNLQTIGQGAMLLGGVSPKTVAKTGFESLDANSPQGKKIEQSLQPTNEMQKYGGYAETGAEVFFGGGKDLLEYGVKKGSETALDAVSKFSKTGDSLATKAVDFISADPEKKVATLLKESTPQELDSFLSTAEKASTDPRLPTPYEVTGKKLNETLPLLQNKLRSIGQAKADIISATREGLSSFSEQTKPLISKLTSLKNSFSEIDKANIGVVDSIIADAKTVSTKLDADKFVDKVQDALYSGNRTMSIPQGSSLDKQLRGIIGEYNDALKSSLPSEYSALNEEYSKMIENISLINRALGETVDGVPLQGASLIKQFFSPSGTKAKEIFDFVKKETNGQVDLAKDATLSKFAMELFDDPRAKSLLQGIPDVPTTISGVVSKVAEKVGGDKLQSVLRESTIKKAKEIASVKRLSSDQRSQLQKMLSLAPEAKIYIDNIAQNIAKETGNSFGAGPLKTLESATRKALDEEGGVVENLKDLARNTIILDNPTSYDDVISKIVEKMNVLRVKQQDLPTGYRGTIINVKAPNGLISEVQIVEPKILYGKDEGMARAILGDAQMAKIEKEVGVKPGLGHIMYEKYRKMSPAQQLSENGKKLLKQSVDYYAKLK